MANFFDDADTAAPASGGNFFDDSPAAPSNVEYVNGRPRITVAPVKVTAPEVTGGQAFAAGLSQGGTLGLAPALVGLSEAGKKTNPIPMPAGVSSEAPGLENVGAGAAALYADNPAARDAFLHGRNSVLQELKAAREQNPILTGAGELTGVLAGAPIPGAGMGATVPARMASGALAGGAVGGLYGAGSAIGAGESPGQVAAQGATGAAMGAAGGAVIPPVMAGIGSAGSFVANKVGGLLGHPLEALNASRNIDQTAAQRIAATLQYDADNAAGGMTAAEVAAAHRTGQSPVLMDVGGAATQELARSASNSSPAGRAALEGAVNPRFQGQAQRATDFIRSLVPTPANADRTQEALERAARTANDPAYKQAYRAGDNLHPGGIWSDELERLASNDDVGDAMQKGARQSGGRFAASGGGQFNPAVTFKNGVLNFQRGSKSQAFPDAQTWDYTYRNLRDAASAAFRAGRGNEGGYLSQQAQDLRTELDKVIPGYQDARAGASAFFKAQNALEAGQKFVTMRGSLEEARQAIGKMSAPERALFAEGFASDLADKVSKISNNRSVTIDRIFNSNDGMARINMALGPERGRQLEMFMRRENMMDLARKAVTGNSTTVRQLIMKSLANAGGHGAVGGAIGAGVDEILNGEVDWKHVLMGGVLAGSGIATSAVNTKLAQSIAQKLASDDPKVWGEVLRIAANNPQAAKVIRRGEGFLEKATGQIAGRSPLLLTAQPAAADQQQ